MTTMAVRALGAGTLVDSQVGTWPTNYMNFAGEESLTEGVYNVYTAEASRMNAATIVANTLEAPIWEKSSVTTNNEVTWEKKPTKTILSDTLSIDVYEDVTLTKIDTKEREIDGDADVFNGTEKETGTYSLTGCDVADSVDMTGLKKGVKYDVWYNANSKVKEVVGIWISENTKQKLTTFDEIVKITESKVTLSIDGAEKEYNVAKYTAAAGGSPSTGSKVVYNNAAEVGIMTEPVSTPEFTTDMVSLLSKLNKENAFGTVTLDGSNIDTLFVEEYTHAGVVKEVTSSKITFESIADNALETAATFKLNDDDYVYNVTKNGAEIDVEDIEVGDIVFYYEDEDVTNDDIYHVMVATDNHEGKVTAVASTYIRLDGTKYSLVEGLAKPNTGDEIVIYLNAAGKIVMFKETEISNSTYAVVKEMRAIEDNKGEITAEITLVTSDGTEKEKMELDIEETCDELYDDNHADSDKQALLSKLFGLTYNNTASDPAQWNSVTHLNSRYKYKLDDPDKSILGTTVTYKEKSGKLVLTEVLTEGVGVSSFTEKKTDYITAGKLSLGTKKSISGTSINHPASKTYYFTDSTVYMAVDKGTKDYRVKVDVVDVNDLETSPTDVIAFVGNINDDNEAKLVVLIDNGKVKRNKEGNYAIVLAKEESDSEDFECEYTVAYADGEEAHYYSDDDDAIEGVAYELTLNGDEITDFDAKASTGITNTTDIIKNLYGKYQLSEKNGVINYVNSKGKATADGSLVLGEDVVYIAYKDNEYTLGKASAINESDDDDATFIESIYTYVDEDGVEEIFAIVYNADKVTEITKAADLASTAPEATTLAITTAQVITNATSSITEKVVTYTAKKGYVFAAEFEGSNVFPTPQSNLDGDRTSVIKNGGRTLVVTYKAS